MSISERELQTKLMQLKGKTQKVDLLNEYSWSIRYVDLGQSAEYAKKALEMADLEKYPRGKAYAWLNLSYVHFLKSENQKALEYLSKGLRFFKKQESERGLPIALNLMGNIQKVLVITKPAWSNVRMH